jgi:hypothetical protein
MPTTTNFSHDDKLTEVRVLKIAPGGAADTAPKKAKSTGIQPMLYEVYLAWPLGC